MVYWKWEESFDVGIDAIDRQHRHILNQMNLLASPGVAGNRARTQQQIEKLLTQLRVSFSMEEKLMEAADYYLYEAHRQAHNEIIERVTVYRYSHKLGRQINDKLLSELGIWLTQHVRRDDRDYVRCVHNYLHPGWFRKIIAHTRPSKQRL